MELADETVTIRTPVEDDAEAVAAAVQASLESLQPWMPWATDDYGPEQALDWITCGIEPTAVPFVVVEGREIVGSTGLNAIDPLNRGANLGYWIRADQTGRGLATAAARLAAAHGIDQLGLHRIEIVMSVENVPSRRVAERVGATHEGIARGRLLLHDRHHDAHVLAMLADDPRP